MVKPSNISKVFHRNAQVLALLNGEDASKIDWQDTHLVWTATNSQRHQMIQYWHNLNEIWELWQKGWCSANNDWNFSCKKESHTILKRHEGEVSVISEELFLECQIVSHCVRSASWVQQPDSPCLSSFPNTKTDWSPQITDQTPASSTHWINTAC